jgi:hypothetical protein
MAAPRRSLRMTAGAAILLQAIGLAGCSPLLLLSALLGGTGGGDHAPINTGPLDGSPSAVQNGAPADTSVAQALAVDHDVDRACLAELPEQPPLPATGCATRPTCMAGAKHPLLLRVCAGKLAAAEAAAILPAPRPHAWDWDRNE